MTEQIKKPSNLFLRFAIGIPVGAACVIIFAFGNISLLLLALVATWLGMREFWRLTGLRGGGRNSLLSWIGDLCGLILVYSAWAGYTVSYDVLLALFLPAIFIFQLMLHSKDSRPYIHDVSATILCVLYIAGFISFIFRLRNLQIGLMETGDLEFSNIFFNNPDMIHFTIFPVIGGWCSDTAAYFSGKYFGLKKLAPAISPKKTWSGLVGAMVGSSTGFLVYSMVIGLNRYLDPLTLIAFGALIAAVSQLGDLTMSAIKREAGKKDSGRILGAHGGLLDRIDGFLFTMPVSYLFLVLIL